MPNPRAQKPLSFEQIIKDAKSLGVPAQALLDALAGGVKGSVSATVGAPADIYNLLNQASFRGQLPTAPYGSEDISKMLPDVIPTDDKSRKHSAEYGEFAGSFIPTPMTGQALKGAVKLGAKGARALGEEAGRRAIMGESFTPFVNTAIPQTHVVKPEKGGAWLDKTVDRLIDDMRPSYSLDDKLSLEQELKKHRDYIEQNRNSDLFDLTHAEAGARDVEDLLKRLPAYTAMHEWLNKNLRNYVKNEMGTPFDPLRKLADEKNKIHLEPTQLAVEPYLEDIKRIRKEEGMPVEGMAKTRMGKSWEDRADSHIESEPASYYQKKPTYAVDFGQFGYDRFHTEDEAKKRVEKWHKAISDLGPNVGESLSKVVPKIERTGPLAEHPWLEKKDPNETIYNLNGGQALNFKPVTETLLNDIFEGRLPAESLKNVSVAQAVARHSDYQDELARKLAKLEEEQQKKNLSANVHKEYDSGHKWIELPDTMSSPENKDFCTGIGKNLGLCTQNDWAAVDYGRHDVGNRLYALIDQEGKPHAQIQTKHRHFNMRDIANLPAEDQKLISKQVTEWAQNQDEYPTHSRVERAYSNAAKSLGHQLPTDVLEIKPPSNDWKGKYSLDREEKYPGYQEKIKPFLDDFVRSGNYGEVGDLYNTNLFDLHKSTQYADDLRSFANKVNLKLPRYLLNQEADILGRHSVNHRLAESAYPESKPIPELPEELRQYQIQPEPPIEGMKQGGAVHISDNPDTMYMELMDKKMKGGGSEDDTKLTPSQWLQAQTNKPIEPFTPIEDLTTNLKAIANLPSRMYEGAKQLVTDPRAYFENMKAPTAEELAMAFNPSSVGLAGMATKVGKLNAIDALFPNKTESMLNSAEKSALTKYKKDLDVPAVMRRELFRTTGTGDIETPSLKMRPEKGLNPDYLENKYVVPILWDTSGAGTNVSQIAGVPLSQGLRSSTPASVQKQGGRLYPLIEENAQQGVGGASMLPAASSKVNNLNTYSDKGPTVGVVMDMAEHGIDFSHHIAEPYIGMLNALRPSNDALKAFKEAIRKTPVINPITGEKVYPYTKFPGIDSPNIRDILSNGTNDYSAGNIRKAIAEVGDTYAMEKLGFPRWSDIYRVMSMPDAKTGQSAKTILEVNPNTQLITPNFQHGSYNTGMGATYAGGLADVNGNIVGVPDTILLKRLFDERLNQGKTIGNVRSSLLKSHHGQLMTAEDIARLREYLGYDKPKKKANGGAIKKAKGGEISEDDIQMEVRPL
jgi:hypothetical protein